MRNSTTFAIASILSAIWVMATVYGIVYKYLGVTYWIEYVFHAIPFISFILCIVLHNMEIREELKVKNKN